MRFLTASVITTLLAMATAAPSTSNRDRLKARDSINDCGDSTFENETSDASPTVEDCQQIATNIADGGTWTVGAGGEHHQLVQYGSCAFGVEGESSANAAYIGNQDIIDLITESIKQFGGDGKVGAKGKMGCQSLTGTAGGVTMIWGIYHD